MGKIFDAYGNIYLKDDDLKKRRSNLNILFFDVETNGLSDHYSVMQFSAIKTECDENFIEYIEKRKLFNRYYFPLESYNHEAISINGLNEETIKIKRGNANYSKHFNDDLEYIKGIFSGIDLIVCHNIIFDIQFIPFNINNINKFCTMQSNTRRVGIPHYKYGYKWPTLKETFEFFNISVDTYNLHDASFDVYATFKIFFKMAELKIINSQEGFNELGKFDEIRVNRKVKSEGGCYIATAIYGNYQHPDVLILRQFRDRHLLSNRTGRIFVNFYYFISPLFVDYLTKHKGLSLFIKNKIFKYILIFIRQFNNTFTKI